MFGHLFFRGLLKDRACHNACIDIQTKEDEYRQQVFAINRQCIKRPFDIEIDRLQHTHEFAVMHALFLHGDHAHTDRCRFDDGLHGFAHIFGGNHTRAVDISHDRSAILCLDGLRQPRRNVNHCYGIPFVDMVFCFFWRIQRTNDMQVRTGFQEIAQRAAYRTVVVIDDIHGNIENNALPVNRRNHPYCQKNDRRDDPEFWTPKEKTEKIEKTFE